MRLCRHILLFAIRGISTVSKFFLTLYVARYLGLAELGIYGLVAAAGTIAPAVLGFGLTDWVVRQIVVAGRTDALRKSSARLLVSVAAHLAFQPLFWIANHALGSPVPVAWIWLIAPIILLEHLASDAHDLLTARGQIALTTALQFIRAALWPIAVVGLGLLYPETRTLDVILLGWLLGLLLMWAVFFGWLLMRGVAVVPRWADLSALTGNLRYSFPLYARDIAQTGSLFIDRYLVSLTLGLELTGVYVFFWSVGNVVHGMVNSVILQPQAARLIGVVQGGMVRLAEVQWKILLEATIWAVLMSAAAFAAMFMILPFLQRPELYAHLVIFGVILFATWARLWADTFGYALLALHRDKAIVIASVVGVLASAALNLLLIPRLGLLGAASAFLLTGLLLTALRWRLSQPSS